MRLAVMDFVEAHNDLKNMFVGGKLNLNDLYDRFGPIRIYTAWSDNFPEAFRDKVHAAGHQLVALHSKEFTDPIVNYIVRDVWQADELYESFVFITPSSAILPVAKALKALGKDVTVVSCDNAAKISKEGLRHRWLHRAA